MKSGKFFFGNKGGMQLTCAQLIYWEPNIYLKYWTTHLPLKIMEMWKRWIFGKIRRSAPIFLNEWGL